MIKVEKSEVFNFEGALRGLRNPLNSWEKSDSDFSESNNKIGSADLNLCQRMIGAGPDESKFMRQIMVSVDITAPLYWWKEFDTYKVGTVANSCSTMHKIQAKEFTRDDFSFEHITGRDEECTISMLLCVLNSNREKFLETKDKKYWWQMIQLLPTSYNQKRTVTLNYQVLRSMYFQRKSHKLDEWHQFCDWIKTLPYAEELICYEKTNKTEGIHTPANCKSDIKVDIDGKPIIGKDFAKLYNVDDGDVVYAFDR